MPPPRTVTCYICGRDFGSRSIGIHLPSCTKKWEQEQEKLPKKERRPLPTAPTDFDKVVKGEITGKALAKVNQKAADEFNEAALEACQWCGRTFLPKPLIHHKAACTEEKPMARKAPGDSYTAQAKAKVNYPKIRTKSVKEKSPDNKEDKVEEEPQTIQIQIHQEKTNNESPEKVKMNSSTPVTRRKPPPSPAKIQKEEKEEEEEGGSGRNSSHSSLVMISQPGSNRSSLELETEEEKEAREQAQFEALEREAAEEDRRNEEQEEAGSSLQGIKPRKTTGGSTSLTRGPGTFRKSGTFVCRESSGGDRREDIVAFLEEETLFDSQEHRKEILKLMKNYVKEVRKSQLDEVLAEDVFDHQEVMEEAVNMLKNLARTKTNHKA